MRRDVTANDRTSLVESIYHHGDSYGQTLSMMFSCFMSRGLNIVRKPYEAPAGKAAEARVIVSLLRLDFER